MRHLDHHAASPVLLAISGELGALPFAFSDVGWVLMVAVVLLVAALLLGALGRRRRRARALQPAQRGGTSR
jgi:hypothetical protein